MSSWGPFDAMDFFESLNVSVTVTLSASESPEVFADLVEYALGDASTVWGAQRIADGHPAPYKPLAWELGNEQTNNGEPPPSSPTPATPHCPTRLHPRGAVNEVSILMCPTFSHPTSPIQPPHPLPPSTSYPTYRFCGTG